MPLARPSEVLTTKRFRPNARFPMAQAFFSFLIFSCEEAWRVLARERIRPNLVLQQASLALVTNRLPALTRRIHRALRPKGWPGTASALFFPDLS